MKVVFAIVASALLGGSALAETMTLYTPAAGDAQFSWNTRYGYDAYTTGGTSMGIYLYMGAPYGNDITISIFEVPIAALAGKPLTQATLQVECSAFGTGYYYGSAQIGWLNVAGASGNVVTDGMGAPAKSVPGGMLVYETYNLPNAAGLRSFDVTSYVASDLAAGRTYSTFVLSGSRETSGSISTAESGSGPSIVAVVPEPATIGLLAVGALAMVRRRR